jgi:glycine/D-amino acid oxidase-like deaminating enzyme
MRAMIRLRTPRPAHDAAVSLWLRQALAGEPAGTPPGDLPTRADVCIVGGGFTGLWTAIQIKLAEPAAEVAVLDAGICGGAASGRNGGFVMTAWSKFGTLRKLCGDADALHYARAVDAAVGEIGDFCAEHGIDAEFHRAGWLWAATNRSQVGAWDATLAALAAAGERPYQRLSAAEAERISGSPVHLAGVFEPGAATVHPAKLARGLRRVALGLGVRIAEHTPVLGMDGGRPLRVRTPRGPLCADTVVLAISAWAAELPEVRRSLLVLASDVVATDPIPERLSGLGLATGISISDSRRLVHYYRTTEDGRMVFGKGGGTLARGARIGAEFDHDAPRSEEALAHLHRTYPMLRDVPAPQRWRGAVDYTVTGLPFIGPLPGAHGVLAGVGFSGNGVGPSYVAGRALAEMALGRDVSAVPEALRRPSRQGLPPEPLRRAGGTLVRAAVARKEAAEDAGRRPGRATLALAALDPTSFVDRGDGTGSPAAPAPSNGGSPVEPSPRSLEEARR